MPASCVACARYLLLALPDPTVGAMRVVVLGADDLVDRDAGGGAYLRALSEKAAEAQFSPGPMVMMLLRRDETRAA